MRGTDWLIPDVTFSQDLSAGALSFTTSIGRQFKIGKIIFKVSAAITEKITITLDSVNGSAYDVILREKTLVGQKDYVFVPDEIDADFQSGDEIKIQCTNANGTATISGAVKARELLH